MRTQKGSLLLQHGSWHVRFYQEGKRKSLRIADEGTDPKKVRQLAATLMLEVNSGKVKEIDTRGPEVMVFAHCVPSPGPHRGTGRTGWRVTDVIGPWDGRRWMQLQDPQRKRGGWRNRCVFLLEGKCGAKRRR